MSINFEIGDYVLIQNDNYRDGYGIDDYKSHHNKIASIRMSFEHTTGDVYLGLDYDPIGWYFPCDWLTKIVPPDGD